MNYRALTAAIYLTAGMLSGRLEAQSVTQLKIGGGTLDLDFDTAPSPALRTLVLAWTTRAANAVTVYYGEFPVRHVAIHIHVIDGSAVGSGHASGEEGPQIDVEIGRNATAGDIDHGGEDWLMTHEMVHLAFPYVARQHHWIEEGLATYVEPVARVRAGELTASQVWRDVVNQMPQGEPEAGDAGLDRTPTWGRTYWGGAMFCLLADVKIRQVTHNRFGLETGLRGILQAGGGIDKDWPLSKALDVADKAIGTPVLRPLYEQMKFSSMPVDLDSLWLQLGIKERDGTVAFDENAPLASIRKAIMSPK